MVTMENYEEYLLLHADGELGEADEKALTAFMAEHPELRHEMEQYMATKMLPDMGMVYEGKDALLKKPTTVIALGQWKIYVAAACVAALIVLGVWKWNSNDTTNINIVQVTNNNINITAPKDTVTEKLNNKQEHVADVSPKPETQKITRPSLQIPPKAHHYVTIKNEITKPEQETIASIDVLPVKRMTGTPVVATPKALDVNVPVIASAAIETTDNNNSGLLARLPIKQEGINEIANAVNNKIEKVRSLRDNIKNTDVSVRLWNKELFVVKL